LYKDIIPLEKLNLLNTSLEKLIPKKSLLEMTNSNYSICFEHDNSVKHFSSIVINQYKIFNNFKMDNLNKINIFAGNNNSGKTSLLEAIYFLTKQNDIVFFLEIIKLKNKLKSLNPVWLNRVFGEDERIEITGLFHNTTTTISFHKFEANDIDKKDDYIASYKLKSIINDRQLDNTIHTFGYSTIQRKNE
jgi:AAA15 family ATPase/GTPase